MVAVLTAALVVGQAGAPQTVCPVMGGAVPQGAKKVMYKGVAYGFCCPGCQTPFSSDPERYLKEEAKGLRGVGLFDPVAAARVDPKKAAAWSEHKGVRYYFLATENKSKFDKEPNKFATAPAREALDVCPVGKHEISLELVPGYRDFEGVRYYFCCEHCLPKWDANPAEHAASATPRKAAVHQM